MVKAQRNNVHHPDSRLIAQVLKGMLQRGSVLACQWQRQCRTHTLTRNSLQLPHNQRLGECLSPQEATTQDLRRAERGSF